MPTICNRNPMTTQQIRFKESLQDRELASNLDFRLEIADPWFLNFKRLRKVNTNA